MSLVLVKGNKMTPLGESIFHPAMGYPIANAKAKPLTSRPPFHLRQAEAGSLGNACSVFPSWACSATSFSAETTSREANCCKSVTWTLPTQEWLNQGHFFHSYPIAQLCPWVLQIPTSLATVLKWDLKNPCKFFFPSLAVYFYSLSGLHFSLHKQF